MSQCLITFKWQLCSAGAVHPRVEWLNYLYLMSGSGHHRDVLLRLLDSSHWECIEYGGGSNDRGKLHVFSQETVWLRCLPWAEYMFELSAESRCLLWYSQLIMNGATATWKLEHSLNCCKPRMWFHKRWCYIYYLRWFILMQSDDTSQRC